VPVTGGKENFMQHLQHSNTEECHEVTLRHRWLHGSNH
jgi:hypothetical protein